MRDSMTPFDGWSCEIEEVRLVEGLPTVSAAAISSPALSLCTRWTSSREEPRKRCKNLVTSSVVLFTHGYAVQKLVKRSAITKREFCLRFVVPDTNSNSMTDLWSNVISWAKKVKSSRAPSERVCGADLAFETIHVRQLGFGGLWAIRCSTLSTALTFLLKRGGVFLTSTTFSSLATAGEGDDDDDDDEDDDDDDDDTSDGGVEKEVGTDDDDDEGATTEDGGMEMGAGTYDDDDEDDDDDNVLLSGFLGSLDESMRDDNGLSSSASIFSKTGAAWPSLMSISS